MINVIYTAHIFLQENLNFCIDVIFPVSCIIVIGQPDYGYAHLVERYQFASVRHAIMVGILPDTEFALGRIGSSEVCHKHGLPRLETCAV
jgi:hypothetical protein